MKMFKRKKDAVAAAQEPTSKEGDVRRNVDRNTVLVLRAGEEYLFSRGAVTLWLGSDGSAALRNASGGSTDISSETMDALVRLWPTILTERARIASLKDTP